MFHRVTLLGRLSRDPAMRYTPSGTAVTDLSIVTSKKILKTEENKCPDGWKESYNGTHYECAVFWKVTVWRGQAEACNQYLAKGSQIYAECEVAGNATEGILNPRIWTGSDGRPRANFELTARNIKFIGRSQSESGQGQQAGPTAPPREVPESEIPF